MLEAQIPTVCHRMYGVQSLGTLLPLVALAICAAVALAVARSRRSLDIGNGKLKRVDYACQVGHGAVDGSAAFAATRMSAPQVAAYAVKAACDVVQGVVERYASNVQPKQLDLAAQ